LEGKETEVKTSSYRGKTWKGKGDQGGQKRGLGYQAHPIEGLKNLENLEEGKSKKRGGEGL